MTDIRLCHLAGLQLPQGRVIDAYWDGDVIETVLRLDEEAASTYNFSSGAHRLTVQEIVAVPRGLRIRLAAMGLRAEPDAQLRLQLADQMWSVPIGAQSHQHLADRNCLFAVCVEPDADVLHDWLTYHAKDFGADAACVLIRGADQALIDAITAKCGEIAGLATLMLVQSPLALGRADEPDERCRHLAPDAPGKGQLPPAPADPERSPLQDIAVLEVMRRRFFSRASAVLHCHPSDLMLPGTDPFDAAKQYGYVRFPGRRVYPYTLPDADTPRHGDHNCHAFDGSRAEYIWCVAPQKLSEGAFWRQYRIADATAHPVGLGYWRCMAIRHPGLAASEIAPRSSLILDAKLAKTVKQAFNATPKAPPATEDAPARPRANDRILIVTTMRNEGPFILEWLAHHRAIGVTDFLVYTNDCTDGTDTMFDLLQEKGIVEHRINPFRETGERPQHAAYHDASETELAKAADWVICMDVDEYINIHTGDGTLDALFAAVPDATLISLTWRLFGNADVATFEDRPITEQFFAAARDITRKPHQAWGFKTLFRNLGHYKKFGVHRPKGLRPEYLDEINWVNGSGKPMPANTLRTGWRSNAATFGYDLVTLNHYALRSAESFLVKRDRGRVNHVERDQGLGYWFRMNHNAEENKSIQRSNPAMRAELARLMADLDIARAHAACVDAHRAKIAELMARPDYMDLYRDITGARLRTLSRMLHHFGTDVFLQGPDAVPEDFHLSHSD